jgi:hypothetical protein
MIEEIEKDKGEKIINTKRIERDVSDQLREVINGRCYSYSLFNPG